jgi:hypothetical protein
MSAIWRNIIPDSGYLPQVAGQNEFHIYICNMVLKRFLGMAAALVLLTAGCETPPAEKDPMDKPDAAQDKHMTFEQRAHREYQAQLQIPSTEKYTLKIYKAHLNADNSEDAIITINRLDFAIDKAAKSKNPSKMVEFGYMGNNNYFMHYDGKTDKFSPPVVVPSSTKTPLRIGFENIQSDVFKTVTVEYHITELAIRSYYFSIGSRLQLVFEWKLFDRAGTADYEANYLETSATGEMSSYKDILIYKGKIKDYTKDIGDIYSYDPTILKSGELLYRFFYDPRVGKYVTRKAEARGPLPDSDL